MWYDILPTFVVFSHYKYIIWISINQYFKFSRTVQKNNIPEAATLWFMWICSEFTALPVCYYPVHLWQCGQMSTIVIVWLSKVSPAAHWQTKQTRVHFIMIRLNIYKQCSWRCWYLQMLPPLWRWTVHWPRLWPPCNIFWSVHVLIGTINCRLISQEISKTKKRYFKWNSLDSKITHTHTAVHRCPKK